MTVEYIRRNKVKARLNKYNCSIKMSDSELSADILFQRPDILEKLLEGISNQVRTPVKERLQTEGINLDDNGINSGLIS